MQPRRRNAGDQRLRDAANGEQRSRCVGVACGRGRRRRSQVRAGTGKQRRAWRSAACNPGGGTRGTNAWKHLAVFVLDAPLVKTTT
ncbi:hypothetical protein GUJ93_ZPchr0009g1527 [Zizania palustris]|uniref:Uncharacterized protein n=1 Tax=Zizania palustris TaxID=103762 RepID=A0A8J5S2G7_ZIZPA|nr:hypothetical protein GUJ93_ZPchr0009g1527 [Zizania palustris]